MSEQRQRFLKDYQLNHYSIIELSKQFSIFKKTAYTHPGHQGKWINRLKQFGQSGYHELSRRPLSSRSLEIPCIDFHNHLGCLGSSHYFSKGKKVRVIH